MKQNVETGLLLFYFVSGLLGLVAAVLVILPDRIRQLRISVISKKQSANARL